MVSTAVASKRAKIEKPQDADGTSQQVCDAVNWAGRCGSDWSQASDISKSTANVATTSSKRTQPKRKKSRKKPTKASKRRKNSDGHRHGAAAARDDDSDGDRREMEEVVVVRFWC